MSQPTTNRDALDQFERRLHDEVSLDEPWDLLAEFATLNRVSGSADEAAAADDIRNRLDELDPAGAIAADATGGGA
jgi:hypothetical protein